MNCFHIYPNSRHFFQCLLYIRYTDLPQGPHRLEGDRKHVNNYQIKQNVTITVRKAKMKKQSQERIECMSSCEPGCHRVQREEGRKTLPLLYLMASRGPAHRTRVSGGKLEKVPSVEGSVTEHI